MSDTTTAPADTAPALRPEITARLKPHSYVTHQDDYIDDRPVWTVVIDNHIVAIFDGEEAAVALRGRIEALRGSIEECAARLSSREAAIQGIRECADWLEAHPDIPIPKGGYFARHYPSGDEFDAVAAAMDAKPYNNGAFDHAKRIFGPLEFRIQTENRAQARKQQSLAEREHRIAAREAALGLTLGSSS